MADVYIDAPTFYKRLSVLQKKLDDDGFSQALIVTGQRHDDNTYKNQQFYKLGYWVMNSSILLFMSLKISVFSLHLKVKPNI